MHQTSRSHWQLRLVNFSFVLLFLLAVGLLQWLAREHHLQFDWTQAHRHSLAPASITAVERLKGPLKITGYASQRGETRRQIQDMVGRYQKYKPDIQLEFVNPDTAPERVRAAGVQFDGELVLEYGEGRENISPTQFSEENFTNALTRLGHRGERWVVFLSGHGERSPDNQANFDLSTWATQLHHRGFKTKTLSLGEHPQIPQNTTVLVIAGPRTRLLTGETKEIQSFVDRGGNLLWLHDPGPLYGLEPLAESLGIEFQPGVIVDPVSETITGNAAAIVVAKYGNHPVVHDFADNTVFPHAGGISLKAPPSWQGSVLIDTRPSSWSETGPLDGPIQFDKGKDIRGPLNLAVALNRTLEKREQRVIVFGNGDFLANSFIANGGNLDLGMSLVNWLSQDDAYVSIPVKIARDRTLDLSRNTQAAIAAGFLIMLPLVMISSGVLIWLRRRKR
ncbi:MAG TPA: GldG family protein [Candidatus Methylomirabilis sp.]|nr:GldG family protein [Candidatus Methylomirabilis sp.]